MSPEMLEDMVRQAEQNMSATKPVELVLWDGEKAEGSPSSLVFRGEKPLALDVLERVGMMFDDCDWGASSQGLVNDTRDEGERRWTPEKRTDLRMSTDERRVGTGSGVRIESRSM